jgi:AmiR/NasT family two-component response regulator
MDRNQVNEEEAFRIMRQMAMERRATIASIAAKLVDSAALLV